MRSWPRMLHLPLSSSWPLTLARLKANAINDNHGVALPPKFPHVVVVILVYADNGDDVRKTTMTRGHKCARGRIAVKVGMVRRNTGEKRLMQQNILPRVHIRDEISLERNIILFPN